MPSSDGPPGGAAQLAVILGGRAESCWTQFFFSLVRGPLAPQVVIVEDEIDQNLEICVVLFWVRFIKI